MSILSRAEAKAASFYLHDGVLDAHWDVFRTIMKEVEQRTAEETRESICNKLDDWVHGIVYDNEG